MKRIAAQNQNPMVVKNANMHALNPYYESLKPDFYIGSEYPERIKKHCIESIGIRIFSIEVGFGIMKRALHAPGMSRVVKR